MKRVLLALAVSTLTVTAQAGDRLEVDTTNIAMCASIFTVLPTRVQNADTKLRQYWDNSANRLVKFASRDNAVLLKTLMDINLPLMYNQIKRNHFDAEWGHVYPKCQVLVKDIDK
jgi:hypothetical protein